MISVNNLSVQFTGNKLFDNVSFIINDKDRIGLVGKNGTGKTTLLKIIANLQEPHSGEVIIPVNTTVGYLPQEMNINSKKSIYDEAVTAFSDIQELKNKIEQYSLEISERDDYESKSYLNIIHKLTEANEKFQLAGGQTVEADTEKILTGLGFTRNDFIRPMSEFSNGWQMRVELAKILLKKPNVLLLDEPTNHLDIESIQWLEDFLINYFGAVILVSHDRAFLDNITKRTIEISLGKIYDYKVSYSDYVKLREERIEQQTAAYNNQQNQIRQIERFIERFRYKSTKARQVQSRIKMLNKIDIVEIDDMDHSAIHFKFPPVPNSGKVVVETKSLSKKYDTNTVLHNIDFLAVKGDSIAFVGKNGEGKTTLAKIIVGDLDYKGILKTGYNVSIGYDAQNQSEMLDPEKTVFETIDEVAIGDIRPKIRTILGSFLFSGDTIDKKVKVLSGGEKSRLSLAKLLLTPVNLLVLDEPTNHLDMQSKDILKNALLHYEGTLIIVSHDRDFLQGLTNKVFEFKNKKIKEYHGDIYDFLYSRKMQSLKELEVDNKKKFQTETQEKKSESKIKWEKKKQFEKGFRKITKQIKNCETEIEELENKISEKDKILINPEKYKDILSAGELYKEYENLKIRLENRMKYWEELHLELEKLKKMELIS